MLALIFRQSLYILIFALIYSKISVFILKVLSSNILMMFVLFCFDCLCSVFCFISQDRLTLVMLYILILLSVNIYLFLHVMSCRKHEILEPLLFVVFFFQ